jgi:hypothetical protein
MKYFTKIRYNERFYKLILRLGQIGLEVEGHLRKVILEVISNFPREILTRHFLYLVTIVLLENKFMKYVFIYLNNPFSS